MEATLWQVLPVFAIALAGYAAGRFRYVTENVFDGLAQFVFTVAVPAFIFRTMARSTVLDKSLGNLGEYLILFFIAAAAALALGMVVARYSFRSGPGEQARVGIAASQSNMVLLGIPAAMLILGSQAHTAIALLIGLHGLVMALLVSTAQRFQGGNGANPITELFRYAKSPLFIALVAGIVFGKFDLSIPAKLDPGLRMIGSAAVPCALFALGGALARYNFGGRLKIELTAAAIKLVAFPLIVWLLAVKSTLFTIPVSWVWLAVMMAAMPTGFELHAKGKRAGGEVSGTAILVSTVLSVLTITVLTSIIRS